MTSGKFTDQNDNASMSLESAAPLESASDVLEEAIRLQGGVRHIGDSSALDSFGRIAQLWTVILGKEISAYQVAQCMVALKLSRSIANPDNADSWVDMAGYAALGHEVWVQNG